MGFGTYYGCICQRQAHTYYPPFLWQNDRRVYLDNELLPPGTPLDAGADPYDPRSYDKYTQRTYSPDAMYDQVLEQGAAVLPDVDDADPPQPDAGARCRRTVLRA